MRSVRSRPREPVHRRVESQVLGDGEVVVQSELLRHVADLLPDLFRLLYHVEPHDRGGARGWSHEPAEHADRGGLSRAVGTKQTEDFASVNGEVEAIDRDHRAEGLAEPARDDGVAVFSRRGHCALWRQNLDGGRKPRLEKRRRIAQRDLHAEDEIGPLLFRERDARRELGERSDGDHTARNRTVFEPVETRGGRQALPHQRQLETRHVYPHERIGRFAEGQGRLSDREHLSRLGIAGQNDSRHRRGENQVLSDGLRRGQGGLRIGQVGAGGHDLLGPSSFVEQLERFPGGVASCRGGPRLGFGGVHRLAAHRSIRSKRTHPLEVALCPAGLRLRPAEIGLAALDLAAPRPRDRLLERRLSGTDTGLTAGDVGPGGGLPEHHERVAGTDRLPFVGHDFHHARRDLRRDIDLADLDGTVAHDLCRGAAVAGEGRRQHQPDEMPHLTLLDLSGRAFGAGLAMAARAKSAAWRANARTTAGDGPSGPVARRIRMAGRARKK